jgi:hypothetical protein
MMSWRRVLLVTTATSLGRKVLMVEMLEDLLAECEAQFELADVWADKEILEGYRIAMNEVCGLLREKIGIERLAE